MITTHIDFEHEGANYRMRKLNAFDQLAVLKRIAPLVPPLIPLATEFKNKKLSLNIGALPGLIQPLVEAFGDMKDEDQQKVISICLSAIQREQVTDARTAFVPIWNHGSKLMMFEDLYDIFKQLPLVVRVIKENLAGFSFGLLTSPEQAETAP
jgi:hypothetical protein